MNKGLCAGHYIHILDFVVEEEEFGAVCPYVSLCNCHTRAIPVDNNHDPLMCGIRMKCPRIALATKSRTFLG